MTMHFRRYEKGRDRKRVVCGIRSVEGTYSPLHFWRHQERCGRCANIITVGKSAQLSKAELIGIELTSENACLAT